MPETPLADIPFFLTRQVANLMEDFARETSRSSSIFLLYGDASVGKSRLLDELVRGHFGGNVIHCIDFEPDKKQADEFSDSIEQSANEMADKFQRLAQEASAQNIILVDHFEAASNSARHQVFQSWVTDGLDKKLNLIIAAGSDQFEEIRQLASQYQANVKSFQLKPFSRDEIEAFTLFYLFPAESSSRLSIPAEIQNQLRSSNGLVGKLIEILSRDDVGTAIKLDLKPSNYKKPLILAATLLAILLVAVFLYPLTDRREHLPAQISSSSDSESPALKQEQVAIKINEPELDESVIDQPVVESAVSLLEPVSDEAVSEQPVEMDAEAIQASVINDQDEINPDQMSSKQVDDAPSEYQPIQDKSQQLTRLQQELSNSLDWINKSDKNSATIQIMMTGFGGFSESAYYTYLDKLVREEIDVSKIRIFQTNATGVVVYSVVYGEYKNRREANKSIQLLPSALKTNKPIPRTIGGILEEIN